MYMYNDVYINLIVQCITESPVVLCSIFFVNSNLQNGVHRLDDAMYMYYNVKIDRAGKPVGVLVYTQAHTCNIMH